MLLIVALSLLLNQQPETLSLLGDPLYAPKLPKAARAAADAELARAHAAYAAKPSGVPEILALSRAHLALGRVGDALVLMTHGIEANPDAPELFLERGRGYILIRKFDVAARDLTRAAAKIPEAHCSLGFAQYLAADYQRARSSYGECPDAGVFGYLAERRAGGTPKQRPVPDGRIPAASAPIRFPGTVSKGKPDAREPLSASYLTAIDRLLDAKTDDARRKAEEDARARLKQILDKNRREWMEPAYIAAEADYARLQGNKKRRP